MENNLLGSFSASDELELQMSPSIDRPFDPANVKSWVQLCLGFHISISPLLLPTAKRKSDGADCSGKDRSENANDVIV